VRCILSCSTGPNRPRAQLHLRRGPVATGTGCSPADVQKVSGQQGAIKLQESTLTQVCIQTHAYRSCGSCRGDVARTASGLPVNLRLSVEPTIKHPNFYNYDLTIGEG
jgi:hypothetical protein